MDSSYNITDNDETSAVIEHNFIHYNYEPAQSNTLTLHTVDSFILNLQPTLNHEQERAFRVIAEHSVATNPSPLRMYLGGPGGTGKSYVIACLDRFFTETGQKRRFRLCSYTGVAATNISGMTLHSALNFGNIAFGRQNATSRRDLIAMWEGVNYLFIDEVSMIGCGFLYRISRALS
ncbi:hypothetical protein C8R42DRAFT_584354, partial [Lentinula raphanica]